MINFFKYLFTNLIFFVQIALWLIQEQGEKCELTNVSDHFINAAIGSARV